MKKQIHEASQLIKKAGLRPLKKNEEIHENLWQESFDVTAKETKKSATNAVMQESSAPSPKTSINNEFAEISNSKKSSRNEQNTFEHQFGARLPVWIGGVALALAGFFTVKYSIEVGLLSPAVRLVIGMLFGSGLIYSADLIRDRKNISNGIRISQALTGAGIAVLYLTIFAATNLYEFIPKIIGFVGLAAVTVIAVISSLKHGMPIAVLGLIGGFTTPALISSNDPSAPSLFTYLYFLVSGLMAVIRKQNWWIMSVPTILISFIWVFVWIFGGKFQSSDTIYLAIFLIATSATVVLSSKDQYKKDFISTKDLGILEPSEMLNYLTLLGSIIILGVLVSQAGFGSVELSLFGIISLGGIALAFFDQKLYGFVPWVSIAVNLIMLLNWRNPDPSVFIITLCAFSAIFAISGYIFQSRSPNPALWAGLTGTASLGYYLLGYYKLYETTVSSISNLWGFIALALSGLGVFVLKEIILQVPESHLQKPHLTTIYASMVTAFLSIGLTIELPAQFLSLAFALQIFSISWINTKVNLPSLRYIIAALVCVFGFLMLPQMVLLLEIIVYSLTIFLKMNLVKDVYITNYSIFEFGFPALLFTACSYLLRLKKDDQLVRSLEMISTALFSITGYYIIRQIFHSNETERFIETSFLERGIFTNILFGIGFYCLWAGNNYVRAALSSSGKILCLIGCFRIIYFDLLIYNPIWSSQQVGNLPLLNSLILNYGLPIFWSLKSTDILPISFKTQYGKLWRGFSLVLAFIFISMNVRQLFHGTYLNGYETTNLEIYSYSFAWLLFGLALLFFGTIKKDKMIRIASLVIMMITVGKVFIYDAAELEGLLRVLSFLGLGLSLLALSWFYSRFVFVDNNIAKKL